MEKSIKEYMGTCLTELNAKGWNSETCQSLGLADDRFSKISSLEYLIVQDVMSKVSFEIASAEIKEGDHEINIPKKLYEVLLNTDHGKEFLYFLDDHVLSLHGKLFFINKIDKFLHNQVELELIQRGHASFPEEEDDE